MQSNRRHGHASRIPALSEISLAFLLAGSPLICLLSAQEPPRPGAGENPPTVRFQTVRPGGNQPMPAEGAILLEAPANSTQQPGAVVVPPPGAVIQPGQPLPAQPAPAPGGTPKSDAAKKSFVTKSAPAGASMRPSKRRDNPASELQFSFAGADWEDVLTWFADETGRTLLMDTKPTGKFNYHDANKYTVSEALDILNNVLLAKGFILVRRDNFLQVVELKDGIPPHLVQRVALNDLAKYGRTELVRVLIPLEGLVAEKIKEEVDQLKGPFGTINALPSVNQLQMVDIAKNVQQVVDLITSINDKGGKADLRVFHLQYVSVLEVEKNVREILGMPARDMPQAQQNQPGAPGGGGGFRSRFGGGGGDDRSRMREMMMQGMSMMAGGAPPGGPGGPGGGNPLAAMMGAQQPGAKSGPFVAADERTNTLFVATTPDNLAKVAMVVKELDVKQNTSGDLAEQTPKFDVYPVAAGMADGLSKVLEQMFNRTGDTKISAHPDGKALIVYAVPREHKRITAILDQLKSESVKTEVIPLLKLEAASTAALVKSLLGEKKEDDSSRRLPFFMFRQQRDESEPSFGPTVEADTGENRLVIRGTELQRSEIRELLVKLGEPLVAGAGSGVDAAKFRIVPLRGREAADIAADFQRIWKQLDSKNPVRIEVMDERPKSDLETPPQRRNEAPPPAKAREARPTRGPSEATKGRTSLLFFPGPEDGVRRVSAQAEDLKQGEAVELVSADEPAQPQAKEGDKPAQPKPLRADRSLDDEKLGDRRPKEAKGKTVTIVFGPDNATVASDDPQALAIAQKLLESLIPPGKPTKGSGFALFYLRSADAQDMAYMVDEALYGQRSPFAIGESNPQQARIIPDTRTNALLVVGPPGEQRKVEALLEKLDREDPPESDIQPKPKPIQMQFAAAADIAREIKEVYADRMIQTAGGGGGGGPGGGMPGGGFAMIFGGGRNRQNSTGKGKIAVSYDDPTNTVLVSAPKDLFDEIEAFAKDLDNRARDNKRVTRVVQLKNADPEVVAAALGNLLGIKTTAKNPNTANAANANANDPNRNSGMDQRGNFGRFGNGNSDGMRFRGGGGDRGGGGGDRGGGGGGFRSRFRRDG